MNNSFELLHIGIDDIDSPEGGCTTHAALYLAYKLRKELGAEVKFAEPLNLVRLNPSIPWKTRGNGAVCIRIEVSEPRLRATLGLVETFIERYSKRFSHVSQSPGTVIVTHDTLARFRDQFRNLFELAVSDVVHLDYLNNLLNKVLVVVEGRGLIGSLASVSWIITRKDYTYELLAYRWSTNWGRERCIDRSSVVEFDARSRYTICNVYNGQVLVSPHGKDPVLYGIRGLEPYELLNALNELRICEPLAGYALFLTNQHTNDHLRYWGAETLSRAYRCGCILGFILRVRHVRGGITAIVCDESGCINVVAFSDTKLNTVLQYLNKNDLVLACGCTKTWRGELFLHLEKLVVLNLYPSTRFRRPHCPRCGSKTKNLGRGRGFRCIECGFTFHALHAYEEPRSLLHKLYLPPTNKLKHLQKPLKAYLIQGQYIESAPIAFECYEPLDFL